MSDSVDNVAHKQKRRYRPQAEACENVSYLPMQVRSVNHTDLQVHATRTKHLIRLLLKPQKSSTDAGNDSKLAAAGAREHARRNVTC